MPSITALAICCFGDQPADAAARQLVRAVGHQGDGGAGGAQAGHDVEERRVLADGDELPVRQVGQRDRLVRLPGRPQRRVAGQEADEPLRALDQEAGDLRPLGRGPHEVVDACRRPARPRTGYP